MIKLGKHKNILLHAFFRPAYNCNLFEQLNNLYSINVELLIKRTHLLFIINAILLTGNFQLKIRKTQL